MKKKKKKKITISEKAARRWLNRQRWNIAKFRMGIGVETGSCWHKQLLLCRRSVGDIRFRIFAK